MTGWPGDYVLVMMVKGVEVVEARGVKVEGEVMLGMMGITGVGDDGDKRGWWWWCWGINDGDGVVIMLVMMVKKEVVVEERRVKVEEVLLVMMGITGAGDDGRE